LELYGLGKHGECGDCNVEAPGFFNIIKKKKWEAWNSKKGMELNEAKIKFIKLSKQILVKDTKM
jgi:acyl-CoA-binding protein